MMRTATLKLNTTEKQKRALLLTMETYTEAFNLVTKWGFTNKIHNRRKLQQNTYYDVRDRWPELNAGLVCSAIFSASDALKGAELCLAPCRKAHSAMRYNLKVARVVRSQGIASISTIQGRVKVGFHYPEYFEKFNDWRLKTTVLVYRKCEKEFYLGLVMEKSAPEIIEGGASLEIDRGLVNIAATSDNRFFKSKELNVMRSRLAYNRAHLQAKGTASAKRKLKKMAGREKRFTACITNRIVNNLVRSDYSEFVVEDLRGINKRKKAKPLIQKLNTWPYYAFEKALDQKCEEIGKKVTYVNPYATSIKCSRCGNIDHGSRNGNQFKCRSCGFELNPDLNASRNIAELGKSQSGRLNVNQPNASRGETASNIRERKRADASIHKDIFGPPIW